MSLFFGDINQDLLKDCSLSGICDLHGLTNLIKEPTCFKSENSTLLDVFLTDKPYSFTTCLNIDIGLSDFHNFICVATKLHAPCESKRKIKYRSMKKFCSESFNRDLDNVPFHVCSVFDDVDDIVWAYKTMYESVLNDHAPVKNRIVSNKQVPHMNSKLRKARNQRNMWRNKHFKCRANTIFRNNYVYWRNKVVSLNRCSIKKYFDEKCNGSNTSSSFFKTISPYISDNKLKNGRTIILRENDNIVTQSAEVAEIFNTYYMSLAEYEGTPDSLCDLSLNDIITKHLSHPSILLIKRHTVPTTTTFNFDFINEDIMQKYIMKLVSKKAPGYDGIQSKILKLSGVSISAPLSIIFNECITSCCFPSDMKLSEISPVFKKNDSLSKENYRSVNILTVISKVFERIISDQLIKYFTAILSDRLSAYRKGYSCQHVILHLTEFWRSALDENKYVGTISTDLSKAFDRMPHGLLMSKLHAYGLSPCACRLLMSYLCDRKQRVKISDSVSEWVTINRGVPQGSVLGPLLFNIFLNDLFYTDISACIANYADDNHLCDSHTSLEALKLNLSVDTEKALHWYDNNRLNANPDKFQCVVMNRNGALPVSISVQDKTINSTGEMNVLGVVLDAKLNFKPYVSLICKRASRQINALRRLSKFLTTDGRLKVYKSFISANFSYCPVTWLFCGKVNSAKLEKLQERALRFVYNDQVSTYNDLLLQANVLSLSMYRLRFLAIEVYKCVSLKNPDYLNRLFTKKPAVYCLRDPDQLYQTKFNTYTYGYRSFAYYGAKLWNKLPLELKNSPTLIIFKGKLNHWIRSDSAKSLEIF